MTGKNSPECRHPETILYFCLQQNTLLLLYCESVGDEKMGAKLEFMGIMGPSQAICEPGAGQVT